MPMYALGSRMDRLGAKDKSIVVQCASGSRGTQAAMMPRPAGFTDVANAGGLDSMPRQGAAGQKP